MQRLNQLTVFVGDTSPDLASKAQQFQADAYLLDSSNYKDFLRTDFLSATTVYTSLGDLPKDENVMCAILDKATHIVYCPSLQWSDRSTIDIYDPTSSMQGMTELLLSIFSKIKNNVTGLDRSKYVISKLTELADVRRSNHQQLWVAGCSIAHGVGVNKDETYGNLLSNMINIPVSCLTMGSSSVEWAADQILRSDIKDGDIVVWGLTYAHRTTWWNENQNKLQYATLNNIKKINVNVPAFVLEGLLTSKTQIYRSVIAVNQVVNFCRKVNAKLLIASFVATDPLVIQLEHLPEFAEYKLPCHPQVFADLGTDNEHPGPKQHQLYAEFCLDQLKNRYHI